MRNRITALRDLMSVGCTTVAIGVAVVAGGIVANDAFRDMHAMFQSGNWSIRVVQEQTGIHAKADIQTDRERTLFGCLGATNQECVELTALCAQVALICSGIGAGLVLIGIVSVRRTRTLKRLIAERSVGGDSGTAAADGGPTGAPQR
jgi:hypothetical protein